MRGPDALSRRIGSAGRMGPLRLFVSPAAGGIGSRTTGAPVVGEASLRDSPVTDGGGDPGRAVEPAGAGARDVVSS